MCIFQTKLKKNFAVCVFSKSILTERTRKMRRRLRSPTLIYALSEVFSNCMRSLVDWLLACVTNSSNQLVVTQNNRSFFQETQS